MCNLPCHLRQLETEQKYIRGSPQHLTAEHQKLLAPTLNLSMERMDKSQNPCDETRDYWENRKGRWVRVHGIARRTPFDPMHDEQPFCQDLTECRRTSFRLLGMRPSRRRRNYRATWTSRYSASISVSPPREKCMQFCSTPIPTCEEELSWNIHVFWWQLLLTKKTHTGAYRYSMLPYSRSFEVHTYYYGCCPSQRVRRHRSFLTRSSSSRVCLS